MADIIEESASGIVIDTMFIDEGFGYLLANEETIKREFGAYAKITDASPKYVMSLDKIDMSHDGIIHVNIVDFLLRRVDLILT